MSTGLLINPEDKTVSTVEIGDLAEVAGIVGYDTIVSDDIGNGNDRLFFDEECFIRGSSGRFQLDKLVPVAGKGVVVGVSADGATISDVELSPDELAKRLRFD
jgi:hypothetical protein